MSRPHLPGTAIRLGLLSAVSAAAVVSLSVVPVQAASQRPADQAVTQSSARAAAVAAFDGCATGYLCFWVNKNKGGAEHQLFGSNSDWVNLKESQCSTKTWNDCASSMVNAGTSGLGAQEYESINYKGDQFCISDYEYLSDLADDSYADGKSWNDSVSSNNWEGDDCGGG